MASIRIPGGRKAKFANSWYDGNQTNLTKLIEHSVEQTLSSSTYEIQNNLKMGLFPHAGLFYSARGLSHLVANAPPLIEQVLIIAPSHYYLLVDDLLSFATFTTYETPLGDLPSFKPNVKEKGMDATKAVEKEHAIEMLLPILAYLQQKQASEIKVSTALISKVSSIEKAIEIGSTLIELATEPNTLILGSTDFTHYGSRFSYKPAGGAKRVEEIDLEVATLLTKGDLENLFSLIKKRKPTICGIGGAIILSQLAKELDLEGVVADYYNSLDVTNEKEGDFVAYCSVLWR